MSDLVNVTIDGVAVQVPKGSLIIEAAKQAGIDIPYFCWHPKLKPAGLCRMCLVSVEKMPKPVASCATPVSEGMVVNTKTEVISDIRRGVLELILANHPLDCPVCDKGGECDLQDLTFKYGPSASRMNESKSHKRKAYDLGPFVVSDAERCIMCRRCVRTDEEIHGEGSLMVRERSGNNYIATFQDRPYDSYFSGNVTDMCPVGALTTDIFRFKGRPWDLTSADSICNGCSVGCNLRLEFRHGKLVRVGNRENEPVDNGWLCDRGRFNFSYVNFGPDANQPARLREPMIRRFGVLQPATWLEAIQEIVRNARNVIEAKGGSAIGVVGGGRLTNEEAYLLSKLSRTAFRTNNVDYRVDSQLIVSSAEYSGSMTDLKDASAVLVIDVLPAEVAPVLDLRIRWAARKGARLAVMGSVIPAYRGRHARIELPPGETAAALDQLAGLIGATEGAAASQTGPLDPEAAAKLAEVLQGSAKTVIVFGGKNAAAAKALSRMLGVLTRDGRSAHLLIPGSQANSRGAEAAGLLPSCLPGYRPVDNSEARGRVEAAWGALPEAKGLSTGEMLAAAAEGQLEMLYVVGANLAATYDDGSLAEKALKTVPFLVVQDVFLTETAKLAQVVLPAAPFAAKSGTYTTLDGQIQASAVGMNPGFESQTDGRILTTIAGGFAVDLVKSPVELSWEMGYLAGLGAAGTRASGATAAVVEALAESAVSVSGTAASATSAAGSAGLSYLPVEKLFAGGGTAVFDPVIRRVRPEGEAVLNPDDARRLGIGDGDKVEVACGEAALRLTARVAAETVPGTVRVYKGLPEAPSNRILPEAKVVITVIEKALEEVG